MKFPGNENRIVQGIAAWLKTPFPCPETLMAKLGVTFFVSILVSCILYVFRPFGISKVTEGLFWFISGYTVIIFMVMAMTSLVLPVIFPGFFDPNHWNISKYLIHILVDYLTISVFTWIYTVSVGAGFIEVHTFSGFLMVTFVVSVFPVMIVVYVYEKILHSRNMKSAEFLTGMLQKLSGNYDHNGDRQLVFIDKNKKITLYANDFICALAKGNYAQIHYLESKELKNKLIRTTLAKVMETAANDRSIIRCHKSAVVNLNRVQKVTGNARNYYLVMKDTDLRIDLSRSVQKALLEQFHNT
jgi:hypothetical protein